MDFICEAKQVFETEIKALKETEASLDNTFCEIVNEILSCEGKVIFCGMGKSGHIANKIAASMSSLGTPSFSLHPAEALHGDLGMVSDKDIVILISHSGESDEITRIIPSLKIIGAKLVALTSGENSTLAKECDIVQVLPKVEEACVLNLAPTSSTTAALAYGDALAVVTSKEQGFNKENFALFHPAGTLGKKLLIRVSDIMATGENIPAISQGSIISDAIMEMTKKGLGVVTVVDDDNHLVGILTDGDLRRAIENKIDMYSDSVEKAMTQNPSRIHADILAVKALKELKEKRINNYPVVDEEDRVIGVLTWQMIIRAGVMI